MSDEIDRRVVEMQFQNKDFERNANETISTLDRLKTALHLEGASSGVEAVAAKFSALQVVGVTALANITNSAVDAGKKIVNALAIEPITAGFSEYELKTNSVRTIMSSTGESIETVNKYLEELNEYSDKTIYSFSNMTQNIGKFTNAGVKLEDAVMAIKGISNEAAVSGANADEASRAMYNFAQALSSGSVKLIDWKSIENANMATMEFKEQLIATGLEMGTLVKVGDKYKSTTTDANGRVSEAFTATSMFNESLSSQWMTTDVLVKTLKLYADETTEIGKKAYEAAGEVTTFSKMCDTLKETAQSGWAKTWEIIFGDLETAKKIFTPLTETIGGLINKMSDFRNNLLEGALSKSPLMTLADKLDSLKGEESTVEGVTKSLAEMQDVVNRVWRGDYGTDQKRWRSLDNEGFDSKAVQSLVNLGYQYSLTIDDVNAAYAKYGNLAPAVIKATDGLTTSFESLSDEQLASLDLTAEEAEQLAKLKDESARTGKSIRELAEEMGGLSGRELLVDSLKNIGESLLKVFGALKDAWIDAFPPPTSTQLYNLIDGFHNFTERIKITDEQADKLCRVFKGVFAAIDLVATVVGGPLKIAFKIITKVLEYFNLDMLDVIAGIADGIVAFRDWLDSIVDFDKVAQTIGQTIEKVAGYVKTWWDGFAKAPDKFKYVADSIATIAKSVTDSITKWFDSLRNSDTIVGNIIRGFSNGLADGVGAIVNAAKSIVTKFVDTVKNLLGIHSPSTVFFAIGKNIIQGLLDGLSGVISSVTTFAKDTVSSIVGIFDSVDWPTVFTGAGISTAMVVSVKLAKAVEQFTSPMKALADVLGGFKKMLSVSTETIKMLGKSIKGYLNAKKFESYGVAFKSFATGLIIIAGALWVLSTIDEKALQRGVITLAVMSALIITMAFVFSKLNGIQPLKALPVIITLSMLLGKLVTVMLLSSLLSPEKFKQGMTAVSAFTALAIGLMACTKLIDTRKAITAAKMFKSISSLIIAMTVAMRICGGMKDDNFKKGLIAVTTFSLLAAGLMLCTKLMTSRDVAAAATVFGSIGLCLVLMALACKIAGSMDVKDAATGIAVIASMTILMALLMVCTRVLGGKKSTIGPTMLAISVALLAMAVAVKIAGTMDEKAVANGITVIGCMVAMLIAMMLAVRIFGSDKKCGGTLLAMSVAIGILAGVCILMGAMEPEQMAKGIIAVGFLTLFMSILMKSSKDVGKGATTILAIGVCVAILAGVAVLLGLVPGDKLAKGVAALDAMMIGLAIVLANAKHISKNKGTIIALAVTIAVLAGCVYLLSTIDTASALVSTACMILLLTDFAVCMRIIGKMGSVSTKSIVAIGVMTGVAAALAAIIAILSNCGNPDTAIEMTACLVVLLTDLSACVAILSKSKNVNNKAIVASGVMAGVAAALAAIIAILSNCGNPDTAIEMTACLVVLLTDLSACVAILSKSNKVNNKALIALGSMTLVVAALAGILVVLDEFDVKADIKTVGSLAILLESLVGAVFIISKIQDVDFKVALKAIGVIALILAAMEGIFVAMAGLRKAINEQFGKDDEDVYTDFMESGIEALNQLGRGIGEFVGNLLGGIAGGIANGFAKSLPSIGESLSEFMENAKGFFDGLGKIPDNTLEAALAVAGAVTAIVAGDLVSSVLSFFTGSSSLDTFSNGVVKIGEALISFYESVKSLDSNAVKQIDICANAAKGIAEMARAIPNDGGLMGAIFGENNLEKWAPGLSVLGENLCKFAESIRKLTEDDVTKMETCTKVTEGIAAMAKTIPNEGGWLGAIMGENSLSVFAPQFPVLGKNLTKFAKSIRSLTKDDVTKMETCTKVTEGIAAMAKTIPNEGGWLGAIMGENSLSVFAPQFPVLGKNLTKFAGSIRKLTNDDVTKMETCTKVTAGIAAMAKSIPNEGGWLGAIVGDNSLGSWAPEIVTLGKNLAKFSKKINTINEEDAKKMSSVVGIASGLAEMSRIIPNEGGMVSWFTGDNSISVWGKYLPDFGKHMKDYVANTNGIGDGYSGLRAAQIAGKLVEATVNVPESGGLAQLIGGSKDVGWWGSKLPDFGKGVKGFSDEVQGIKNVENLAAVTDITKTLASLNEYAPEVGGLFQMFTGTKDMSKMGEDFGSLGKGLKEFASAIVGSDGKQIIDYTSKNVESAVNIATTLSGIYEQVHSTNLFEYILELFTGDKITQFSNSLSGLGTSLGKFVTSFYDTGALQYLGDDTKSPMRSVLDIVQDVCDNVYSDDAYDKIYQTSQSLGLFADEVVYLFDQLDQIIKDDGTTVDKVKNAVKVLVKGVKSFAKAPISDASENLDKLGKAVIGLKDVKEDDVKSFVNAITSIISLDSQKDFTEAFEQLYTGMQGFGSKITEAISQGVQNNWAILRNGITTAFSTSRDKMSLALQKFKTTGQKILAVIGNEMVAKWKAIYDSLSGCLYKVTVTVNESKYTLFKNLGSQMMQGFADGITAKKEDVASAASAVAQAAADATKTTLDIHSPSRVLMGLGEYAGQGFVVGLKAYQAASYSAGETVADAATNGINESIAQIQRLMESGMEWQPTITPVLDLSGVQNGASRMQSMLTGASVSASTANTISFSMNSRTAGASNTDIVKAINDLNKRMDSIQQNVYNVNGITYDDGSNVASAVGQLVNAMQIKRRV